MNNSKRMWLVSYSLLVLAMVFLLLQTTEPAIADDTLQLETDSDVACHALDIVFLIDQSTSMNGFGGKAPSDPTQQRTYAPQTMVAMLAGVTRDTCPGTIHRVAVVSFARTAKIDLDLTPIDPETYPESINKIKPKNLEYTNPAKAFAAAAKILNEQQEEEDYDLGKAIRKRAVILITDGQPCPAGDCEDPEHFDPGKVLSYTQTMSEQVKNDLPFDTNLRAMETCLAGLRAESDSKEEISAEKKNDCLRLLKLEEAEAGYDPYQDSTYLWILMLSPPYSYTEGLRDMYDGMTRYHAGRVIEIKQNRQEIPTALRGIIEQLLGVETSRLQCGRLAVNPYLKRAIFDFYKFDKNISVTLAYTDTEGTRYEISGTQQSQPEGFTLSHGGYITHGANERYIFENPYPGFWQLQSDTCDSFDAFYEPVVINPEGYQPWVTTTVQFNRYPYYDARNEVRLDYAMYDEQGMPMVQHPWFEIEAQLTVLDPENSQHTYELVWEGGEDCAGRFCMLEPVRVPYAGTYKLEYVGTAWEHVGDPTVTSADLAQVFTAPRTLFHEQAQLEVRPARSFMLSLLSPAPNSEIQAYRYQPDDPLCADIPVVVQLIDQAGQPLTKEDHVFANDTNALVAVAAADPKNRSEQSFLQQDPTRPDLYKGVLTGSTCGEQGISVGVQIQGDVQEGFRAENRQVTTTLACLPPAESYPFLVILLDPTPVSQVQPYRRSADSTPRASIPILAQLVDQNGDPLRELDRVFAPGDHDLVAVATTTSQTEPIQIPLVRVPAAPGLYQGEITNFSCENEPVSLRIELEGHPVNGYSSQNNELEAILPCTAALTPFDLEIRSPAQDSKLTVHGSILEGWPLPVHPVPVRVEIVDSQGQLISETVFADENRALEATLSSQDGVELQSIALRPDPDMPGWFDGTVSECLAAGPMRMDVQVVGEPVPAYQALHSHGEVEFTRSERVWTHAGFYISLFIVAIVSLISLLMFLLYRLLSYRRVSGTLHVLHGDKRLTHFSLKTWKNWKSISLQELGSKRSLGLRKLRVAGLGKRTTGIRVEYTLEDGCRKSEYLPPNTKLPFNTIFAMEYEPSSDSESGFR